MHQKLMQALRKRTPTTPSRLAKGDAHRWVCYQDGPRSVQHGAGPHRQLTDSRHREGVSFPVNNRSSDEPDCVPKHWCYWCYDSLPESFWRKTVGKFSCYWRMLYFLHYFIFKELISKLVWSAHSLQRDRDTGDISGEKRQLTWV